MGKLARTRLILSLAFFDTNILLYSVSAEPRKADCADALLAAGGVISVQGLNESARVLLGKQRRSWPETRSFLNHISKLLRIVPVDIETHQLGLDLAERYQLAIYDAMIAAAALQSGCDTLYSEDMHSGLQIDGRLTLVNPFAA